jgi:serine/threonine protein phosphatase PrpC
VSATITDPSAPTVEITVPEPSSPTFVLRSFGQTDRGKVRRRNEDHFLIAELARTLWVHQTSVPQPQKQYSRNRAHILLVADGIGGHQAGEVASALTVASIEGFVLHLLKRVSHIPATDEQTVLKEFQEALRQADALLFEEAAQHPEFEGMGTTVTLGFVTGRRLFVVHAGDCRCYLYRSSQLRQLTSDHTLAGEMARRGMIKPEEVCHHHWRHVVTNVLGGKEAGVTADVQQATLEEDDVILLCSDGLTEMLNDERIAAVLASEAEPEAACKRLIAEANDHGGSDNITAIVARFETV